MKKTEKSPPIKLYRTWIEIDTQKLRHNVSEFLKLVPAKTRMMAVIKSNAYGHGIIGIAKSLEKFPAFRKRGMFGVDSVVEAFALRKEGITLPILVLGYTLPIHIREAAKKDILLTVSTFQTLKEIARLNVRVAVHIKCDTGMHRQGFFENDLGRLLYELRKMPRIRVEGVYTHFAAAKDGSKTDYTRGQLAIFNRMVARVKAAYPKVLVHASASGGSLLFPEAHFDIVRIGMGAYGYWPSKEVWKSLASKINLKPVLAWKSLVSEVKRVPKGSKVGYDGTEIAKRDSTLAIVPAGYWHGYDRGFSSRGEVLIKGKRAKVMGRVSMDMIVVDVTAISGVKAGECVTIIGQDGKDAISAEEMADMLETSPYEILTRINPLIQKLYQ